MNFFDLVNISERSIELINPSSPQKVLRLGQLLGLETGMRVIDFGCGFAEPLTLWAKEFGIHGVGIDIRPYACERAQKKVDRLGLGDQVQIICKDAAQYQFPAHRFEVATCLGATFIWDGFAAALQAMKAAVVPDGMLGIGEVHWLNENAPESYQRLQKGTLREIDFLHLAREAGMTVTGIVRSSPEDWDRYESDNWRGLLAWLAENPTHPERDEVQAHLQRSQDEYLKFGRQYLGWAMYALQSLSH
jgi:ubiquinone/menaquinone biosynthesis C-methylase UbiE